MSKSYFVNWFYLKIYKNYDEFTVKLVNSRKANSQVDESKLIKFRKPKNEKRLIHTGLYRTVNGRKVPIPDYHPSSKASVTILAKENRHTVFIYYLKESQRFYYGITNSSIKIEPNKGIIILSYFIDDYSQAPFMVDVFLCGHKSKKTVKRLVENEGTSAYAAFYVKFRAEEFTDYFEFPEDIKLQTPPTFLNQTELKNNWLFLMNRRRRPLTEQTLRREFNIPVGANIQDMNDVNNRRDQYERAIEEARDNWQDFVRANDNNRELLLPPPDENGYYHFTGFTDNINYDPLHPERVFNQVFLQGDNGTPTFCYISNGLFTEQFPLQVDQEVHVKSGEFAFYYCPTYRSYGIRYKKHTTTNVSSEGGNRRQRQRQREQRTRETARFLKKYIYLRVLGNPSNDVNSIDYMPMHPTKIDFYSKSRYYLGRLEYDQVNIRRKDQVEIPYADFESSWEERNN